MKGTLYLKLDQSVELKSETVTIGDVAELEWEDAAGLARVKAAEIFKFPAAKQKRYVISALYLVEQIHKLYPGLTVTAIGEPDTVVELCSDKKRSGVFVVCKVALICLIVLFGASFAIMSFNNDVSVEKLFAELYEKLTGHVSNGFTVIEVGYSLGLAAGILIFYNHFNVGHKSQDPTPIEVEMQVYEEEINTTLIENADRNGIHQKAGMRKGAINASTIQNGGNTADKGGGRA